MTPDEIEGLKEENERLKADLDTLDYQYSEAVNKAIPALEDERDEARGLVELYEQNMKEPCRCGEAGTVGECLYCATIRVFEEKAKVAIERWKGEK